MSSTDPHYDNVVLLLPMNGPDNGTTFLDRSKTPKTITNNANNIKTQTGNFKFYDSSGYNSALSSPFFMNVAAHADFNFGGGDFTIDCWINTSDTRASRCLIYKNNNSEGLLLSNGTWALFFNSAAAAGDVTFQLRESNTTHTILSGGSGLLNDAWQHVELCRNGSDWGLFINGTLVDDGSYSGFITNISKSLLLWGYSYAAAQWRGYMQDLRITKGVARHTANFTPPTRGAFVQTFINGVIKDDTGTPCERIVRAYRRDTGAFVAQALSDAVTGEYELESFHDGEHQRIVLDDAAGTLYNDLIDRVVPGP
jgi:hypothetical protein